MECCSTRSGAWRKAWESFTFFFSCSFLALLFHFCFSNVKANRFCGWKKTGKTLWRNLCVPLFFFHFKSQADVWTSFAVLEKHFSSEWHLKYLTCTPCTALHVLKILGGAIKGTRRLVIVERTIADRHENANDLRKWVWLKFYRTSGSNESSDFSQ